MKIRLLFEKNLKYISHLDLMKTMQKILKRTGLPLKYTEGFNPHMILTIANPLPLGVVGKQEFAEFELKSDSVCFGEVKEKLRLASPEGIVPLELYTENLKNFNLTTNADYEICIVTKEGEKISALLERETLPVLKVSKGKPKEIDVKALIYRYRIENTDEGVLLCLNCACGNEKNLNPMLLKKLILEEGIQMNAFLPVRTGFYDANGAGFGS